MGQPGSGQQVRGVGTEWGLTGGRMEGQQSTGRAASLSTGTFLMIGVLFP